MRNYWLILLCFVFFGVNPAFSQDSLATKVEQAQRQDSLAHKSNTPYNPLAPSKAAFYSAVLPGLGQAYNHSYWKIPLVYGGIGTGIYFYIKNSDDFHRFRNAYKERLAGKDDEFKGKFSDEGLRRAQKQLRKNKQISIFVTVLIYALNIIDANVEAHLGQFNVSKDLTMKPDYEWNEFTGDSNYGISFNLKF